MRLDVSIPGKAYPIYIEDTYDNLPEHIRGAGTEGSVAVVTDSNVAAHQLANLRNVLSSSRIDHFEVVLDPGEKNKNLKTINKIYSALLSGHIDRRSAILAFGGGVVGDMAGFAASTFLRGIRYFQLPTSLLAQVDSSVGGKTGVDYKAVKNLIGSFYQPQSVHINVDVLKTLPACEFRSGMAEMIKHALICDPAFFDFIEGNIELIMNLDPAVLKKALLWNCKIKAGIVEKDEKEAGVRALLNLGHTFGHAIESASGYKYSHGECVAVGMLAALNLSNQLGHPVMEDLSRVRCLLKKIGLPVDVHSMNASSIYKKMRFDKKSAGGRLKFIIPLGIGKTEQLFIEDKSLVMKAVHSVLRES